MTEAAWIFSDSTTTPIGEVFMIKDELGRGTTSVVKKATKKASGDLVALKIIDKRFVDPDAVVKEVAIMKELDDHPGFIHVKEVFEDNTNLILVEDLVTGGELFDKIVELNTFAEKDAASLVQQIASIISYLHSKDIVHRDLKPENLLFVDSNSNKLKLCDFGTAEIVLSGTVLQDAIGSPGYMAPEVVAGIGYDKSVDIFSFGVIMYVMLSGTFPYDDEEAIPKRPADFPSPDWDNVSDVVKKLIGDCLNLDPAKRPTAQRVLDHPWVKGENIEPKKDFGSALPTLRRLVTSRKLGGLAGNAINITPDGPAAGTGRAQLLKTPSIKHDLSTETSNKLRDSGKDKTPRRELSVDSDKSDRSLKRESSSGSSKDKSKDKDKLKREVSSGSSKEREKDKEKLKREVSSGSSKDKSDREKVKREVSSGSKDKGRSTPSRELSLNDSRNVKLSSNILNSVASMVSDTLDIPKINSPMGDNLSSPKMITPKSPQLAPWLEHQDHEPRLKTPRMQASIRDIRQVMSQIKQKEEENAEKQNLKRLKERAKKLVQQLANEKDIRLNSEKLLQHTKKELLKKETESTEQRHIIQQLQSQIRELQTRVDSEDQLKAEFSATRIGLDSRLVTSEKELNQERDKRIALEREIESLRAENEEKNSKLVEATKTIRKFENQAKVESGMNSSQTSKAVREKEEEFAKIRADLDGEIARLKQEMEKLEEDKLILKWKVEELSTH
jgi:serine/threonine protein kinase